MQLRLRVIAGEQACVSQTSAHWHTHSTSRAHTLQKAQQDQAGVAGPKGIDLGDRTVLSLFHGYMSEYICPKCWKHKMSAFCVNVVYMNPM